MISLQYQLGNKQHYSLELLTYGLSEEAEYIIKWNLGEAKGKLKDIKKDIYSQLKNIQTLIIVPPDEVLPTIPKEFW